MSFLLQGNILHYRPPFKCQWQAADQPPAVLGVNQHFFRGLGCYLRTLQLHFLPEGMSSHPLTPPASSGRSNSRSWGWLEASAPGALTVQEVHPSVPLPAPKSSPLKGRGGSGHHSNCRSETWHSPAHLPLHSVPNSLWTSGTACQVAALLRDQKKNYGSDYYCTLICKLEKERKRERTASMCQAMKGLWLKPPEKQTLNLNVNESAEETSEALVSLQGAESPGPEFMAPFTSPLPFSAPSAREVRKGKEP